MDPFRSKAVNSWFASATGTTAATATAAATTATSGARRVVTHISGSSDAAFLVTLAWTDEAGTSQSWKKRFSAAGTFSEVFPPGEIAAQYNSAVTLTISAGTSNCEANMGGYTR